MIVVILLYMWGFISRYFILLHLCVCVCVYIYIYIYISIFMPDYHGSIVSFEIRKCEIFNFVLFILKIALAFQGLLRFHMNFRIHFSAFAKNVFGEWCSGLRIQSCHCSSRLLLQYHCSVPGLGTSHARGKAKKKKKRKNIIGILIEIVLIYRLLRVVSLSFFFFFFVLLSFCLF